MERKTRPTAHRSKRGQCKRVLVLAPSAQGSMTRVVPPELRGAMDYGRRHGWDMIDLYHWRNRIPEGVRPDGLIAGLSEGYHDFVEKWSPRVPSGVIIGGLASDVQAVAPYALINRGPIMIGDKAAEYFLQRGFENHAVCHYDEPDRFTAITEFEERVKVAGGGCISIPCNPGTDTCWSLGRTVKHQLAEQALPLAIFCMNDRLALRVCRWCLEIGLAVPEQVAILGLGNDLMACEYSPVPLSSVDLMPETCGLEAARLLQRMMDGEPAPSDPLLVPVGGIITRRSTDILAVRDTDVAHALRYIWDHYLENISVDEIAIACGTSQSKLSSHFRASLGRTLNQELTRHRLEKACELLTTGDTPIIDIAALTGYRSPQYFNDRFTKTFGISPEKYRRREREKRRFTNRGETDGLVSG